LVRQGYWLEATSMVWTGAGAAAALTVGAIASSIALIGLGIDTALDLFLAAFVIWHLGRVEEGSKDRGLHLICELSIVGAAYLFAVSILNLTERARPERSVSGLAIAAGTLLVMSWLATGKRHIGRALQSRPLAVDAAETALCGVAAAATLLGVGLDDWFGWWWMIPAAGLAIGVLACWGGVSAWVHRD
jgi:divalent metal cation (Fe/Co/Zn/Cd) transporter